MPAPRIAILLGLMAVGAAAHPLDEAKLWVNITIQPRAVEWIVSIRADLAAPWLRGALPPEDLVDFITPEEDKLARDTIAAYFASRNPVTIDGRRGEPVCVRVEAPESPDRRTLIDYLSFRIVYPCDGWPRKVSFLWEDFEPADFMGEKTIPGTLLVGPQIETCAFSEEEPLFVWAMPETGLPERTGVETVLAKRVREPVPWRYHLLVGLGALIVGGVFVGVRAPLRVWVVLLFVLGGAAYALPWEERDILPPITELQAATVLDALLDNVYRAFEGVTEEQIYDLLAVSVEPQLVDRLYLEIRQGLEMREEGGAIAAVGKIERRGCVMEFNRSTEFRARWRWQVYAHVSHWGHTHSRLNEYLANFLARADGSSWRIADYELLESERVPIEEIR